MQVLARSDEAEEGTGEGCKVRKREEEIGEKAMEEKEGTMSYAVLSCQCVTCGPLCLGCPCLMHCMCFTWGWWLARTKSNMASA